MLCVHHGNRWLPLTAWILVLLGLSAAASNAAAPPCNPCAGIVVSNVSDWLAPLAAEPALNEEARLYVAWATDAKEVSAAAATEQVAERGAVPWLRVRFSTPVPLTANLDQLASELEGLAALVRASHARTHFQIEWSASADSVEDYAFLLKRAAVAVTGARTDAPVISQALPAAAEAIDGLYGQEIAAYVDGIALLPAPAGALAAATELLGQLDPGKPVVVMAFDLPHPPSRVIVEAASKSANGVAVTFFAGGSPSAEALAPLKVLANEFQGADLAYDPFSAP
ncbi:MAG: hypothetical protein O7A04_05925, partial [Acidobacteria bacterium]|nr:hypothetical protein [Acidobacteriota bacterium]